jgi:hypothetical protein
MPVAPEYLNACIVLFASDVCGGTTRALSCCLCTNLPASGVHITPAAVNQISGLPKPTLHRLMSTLSIHASTQRIDLEALRVHLPSFRLQAAAAELSELVIQ